MQAFKDAIGAGQPLRPESGYQSGSALPSPWDAGAPPTLKDAEEALIAAALRHADGNQGVAAGLLGVSRQALDNACGGATRSLRCHRRDPQPDIAEGATMVSVTKSLSVGCPGMPRLPTTAPASQLGFRHRREQRCDHLLVLRIHPYTKSLKRKSYGLA